MRVVKAGGNLDSVRQQLSMCGNIRMVELIEMYGDVLILV
jgi:hypothetical protein